MRFLRFFLFCECFNWGLWGLNYSKIAKNRFLIDSNTFWMILGTFKILYFLDPRWTLEPRISHEFISKNTRKYGNILGRYGFGISENLKISIFRKYCVRNLKIFVFCFVEIFFSSFFVVVRKNKSIRK